MKRTVIATVVFASIFAAVVPAHASVNWSEFSAAAQQWDIGTTDNQTAAFNRVSALLANANDSEKANLNGWIATHAAGTTLPRTDVISVRSVGDAYQAENDSYGIQTFDHKPTVDEINAAMGDGKIVYLPGDPAPAPLGASKLNTSPSTSKIHHATSARYVEIHNDSSDKRNHQRIVAGQAEMNALNEQANAEITAQSRAVNATSYKLAESQEQQKVAGAEVSPTPHATATAKPAVAMSALTPATKAPVSTPVAVQTASQPTTTAAPVQAATEAPVAPAATYQEADPETVAAINEQADALNELIDAHNENVAAIDDNTAHIASLEQSTNQHFRDMDKRISDNRKRAAVGVAGVAAMANIPQVQESQLMSVGAGVGTYDNQQAVAVGVSFHVTQHAIVKASVGAGSYGGATAGAGVAWGW